MEVPQKIKNVELPHDNNFTFGYLSKEIQNINLKRYIHSCVYCSIICSSQDIEATEVSFNRRMVHIYNGILLSHKNE